MRCLCIGFFLGILTACNAPPKAERVEDRVLRLADALQQSLSARGLPDLGTVVFVPDLDANARFEEDTIKIGQIQSGFHTDDDWISVIYHEYWHSLQEDQYAVATDSLGNILQWDTEEWYTYQPTKYRIQRSLQYFQDSVLPQFEPMSNTERKFQMEEMRATLSSPQEIPFKYAPSNLSLGEIEAYQAQLKAEREGLYHLSREAIAAIAERIAQQQDTYRRRKEYESRHQLGPDGNPNTLSTP